MATIVCSRVSRPVADGASDSAPGIVAGLARALTAQRERVSGELYRVVAEWERTAKMVAEGGVEFVLQAEKRPLVDYLTLRFERGDVLYEQLYVGEKLKQLHWSGAPDAPDERRGLRRRIVADEKRVLHDVLDPLLDDGERAALTAVLERVYATVLAEGERRARVLLVGDCLHLDIVTFAQPLLAAEGITLDPTFATSKNPVQLRREIGDLEASQYDAVFYSPFTYEFLPELEEFRRLRTAARAPWQATGAAAAAFRNVEPTLRLLAERFECPIVVHNTAQVARSDGSLRSSARLYATALGRRRLAAALNRHVAGAVDELNRAGFEQVHVLDETSWLRAHGERYLSRYLHAAEYQHPAMLGRVLAGAYVDVIAVVVNLLRRKLVVCDLDNTLWEGVIGDGPVRHLLERQASLLALKRKGVVLAVNSKNDPRNVRFDGGTLGDGDFVHREINWDSKVLNTKRIAEALNLKTKDFVFVDDRADERALVAAGVPGIVTLDATDERVWRRIALWADLLAQGEGDRTELYRQYQARREALSVDAEDEQALLSTLQLRVEIRVASEDDLRRVVELVNRTNQFNLQGSRTTLAEVQGWHADPATTIVVAEASDRFGSNGTVCVAVVRRTDPEVELLLFVLSCRVFGYEIERAVMNYIKRSLRRDAEPIVARLVVTPHNGPCHEFLPRNGFEPAAGGEVFTFHGASAVSDPPWLAVATPTHPL
jgi:FkbH-like protein